MGCTSYSEQIQSQMNCGWDSVAVYQLIADKTIEEQITNLQRVKAELAQEVLSGEGIHSILIHKEDVLKLL